MGLFSSKSSSRSTTNYYDYSRNMSVDLSSGELGGGSDNNIVATGDVYYAGMSDNLANNFLNAVNSSTDSLINGTAKMTDKLIDGSINLTKEVLDQGNALFNDTFKWIQNTIGSAQAQTELVSSQLAQAYNSEQATHSAIKTYSLYGLIGFLGYIYFVKRK